MSKLTAEEIIKQYPNFDLEIALRALRVIEGLTFEDIITLPKEKIEEIYIYAHVGIGHCGNPHPDWCKRLAEAEKALVRAGIIAPPYCKGGTMSEKDRAPEDILREVQETKILVIEVARDKIRIEEARIASLEQRLRKAVVGCLRTAVDDLGK